MEETPLAMASVPVQKWRRRYDDAKALEQGTIFSGIWTSRFFAAETLYFPGKCQEQTERDRLLTKIRQTGFVLDDLTLYLDTHQDDREAAQLYREKSREKEQLMGCFAEQFYPSDQKLCRGMWQNRGRILLAGGPYALGRRMRSCGIMKNGCSFP